MARSAPTFYRVPRSGTGCLMPIDDRAAAGLARLTANEKDCLRRRLLPQTAKEMAVDLGVSPHAVEKRLKMARMKLGVSSSLVAARLLAEAERYQPLVPQGSDLSDEADQSDDQSAAASSIRMRLRRPHRKGLTMIAAILLLALAVQDVPRPTLGGNTHLEAIRTRKVGMDEAAAFIRPGFHAKDRDGSGYLEPDEAAAMEPRDADRDATLPPAPPAGAPDPAAARKWMAKLDTDRDGRVSEEEYVAYLLPWILWQGVPEDWHPAR